MGNPRSAKVFIEALDCRVAPDRRRFRFAPEVVVERCRQVDGACAFSEVGARLEAHAADQGFEIVLFHADAVGSRKVFAPDIAVGQFSLRREIEDL